jgi:hypothetical protein
LSDQNTITDLKIISAPWNKTIALQNISYEGGVNMLRFRIKEGKRFTDLELDPQSLDQLNTVLSEWLALNTRKF